jgi:hypothetical protein
MSDARKTEIEELLPFWINGTLQEPEAAKVAAAVSEDPALQQEAELLRAVRRNFKDIHEAHAGPGEFGLARLNRTLDAEKAAPMPRKLPVGSMAWGIGSAIAASLATVLVLGTQTVPEPIYEQASGEPAAVVVSFSPDASVAEISALVRERGLTIIDGPSAFGLFRMIPLPGEPVSLTALAAQLEEDERVLRVDIEE